MRDFGTIQLMSDLGFEFVGLHAITSLEVPRLDEVGRLVRLIAYHRTQITPVLLTKVLDIAQVARALDYTGIDWVQLHQPWSISELYVLRCELLKRRSTTNIILLIDPTTTLNQRIVDEYMRLADFAILDHGSGGTGRLLPAEAVRRTIDMIEPSRLFIAGGLDPDNVAEIVRKYTPYAVDVQTGLLDQSGNHDPIKLAAFIHAVRSVRHSTD